MHIWPHDSRIFHMDFVKIHYRPRMLYDEHVAVQSVIFGIRGSFWCEAKQNPRESAVWRDFTMGIDLMDHYSDVSRTGDLRKLNFSSFFRGSSFCYARYWRYYLNFKALLGWSGDTGRIIRYKEADPEKPKAKYGARKKRSIQTSNTP